MREQVHRAAAGRVVEAVVRNHRDVVGEDHLLDEPGGTEQQPDLIFAAVIDPSALNCGIRCHARSIGPATSSGKNITKLR